MELYYSRKELGKAKISLEKMKEITKKEDESLLIEFESNWIDFLSNLEKVWKKSERECSHFSTFQPWQGKFVRERKNDPVLKYLKNARDADHHDIKPITIKKGYDGKIVSINNQTDLENGFVATAGETITVKADFKNPRIEAESFKNFGKLYKPPIDHFGIRLIERNNLIEIAELGIQYYEKYLEKIELKFN